MAARLAHTLQSAVFVIAVVGLWQLSTVAFAIPAVVFPAPAAIAVRLFELVVSGEIWPHLVATVTSILSGFGIGIAAGIAVGAVITLAPVLERLIYPWLIALQSVPKIAIAPLFVLWFGYGLMSKVVITALLCFFPVLVSVIAGFNATDRDQLEMMKSFGASRWQTLRRLRIPAALVLIFAGIEIAAVLAVIGAVVGEFVGAQEGLGYLITALNFSLDVPGVFAVLILLSAVGICLHTAVRVLSRRLVFWIHPDAGPMVG